jgi:iron(II)-dependent oxidoreductase
MSAGRDPLHGHVVAERLAAVRRRTLELVSRLDEPILRRQHISILSPMIWDLGHIANFEETWILGRLGGLPPRSDALSRMFDPGLNPRPTRAALPLPYGEELQRYLEAVRDETLRLLESGSYGGDARLAERNLVFELVAEHEEQHQETLLQAMQILEDPTYEPIRRRATPTAAEAEPEMVSIPAGPCWIGCESEGFSYDNERRAHEQHLPAFDIDRYPVTAGQFLEFVEAGGYSRRELWSDAGWSWRCDAGALAPANWLRRDDGWHVRFMDRVAPLDPGRPVIHVCFHEAEAYCRFAGKRLPTEFEWEKAALWDPEAGRSRRYPWGDDPPEARHANLDQLAFEPAAIGAYPEGASAYGVEQLIGDIWEWTASDFRAYPGFIAHPYPEYSEIFFGTDYKVLRGGSWATRPAVARGTFRNWDFPIRRQIFAGFRCARDV